MYNHIRGTTVTLYTQTKVGEDPFGAPLFEEISVDVENVLVSPGASKEVLSVVDLTGKKDVHTLGIPKGDLHDWEDKKVSIFGKMYKTFGFMVEGIEENIPGPWHRQIACERYE